MKNLIKIIIVLFTINIFGQTIVDIEEMPFAFDGVENTYYKDINNYINVFEGTWIYTNGDTTFKLVLEKKEMMANEVVYFQDYLVGEYQYIVDEVELINTLSNTNLATIGIFGKRLLKNTARPICNDCPVTERRIKVLLVDRTRESLTCTVTLKRIDVGGQPALEAIIWGNGVGTYDVNNPPEFFNTTTPSRTFIFIKQ